MLFLSFSRGLIKQRHSLNLSKSILTIANEQRNERLETGHIRDLRVR